MPYPRAAGFRIYNVEHEQAVVSGSLHTQAGVAASVTQRVF